MVRSGDQGTGQVLKTKRMGILAAGMITNIIAHLKIYQAVKQVKYPI